MKTVYQVRIYRDIKDEYISLMPWGHHGDIVEALLKLIIERAKQEGSITATAKLLDGRYKLETRHAD